MVRFGNARLVLASTMAVLMVALFSAPSLWAQSKSKVSVYTALEADQI